jgi:hypothetical protein
VECVIPAVVAETAGSLAGLSEVADCRVSSIICLAKGVEHTVTALEASLPVAGHSSCSDRAAESVQVSGDVLGTHTTS